MKAKLTYFRAFPSFGKYYSEGELEVPMKDLFLIWNDVRELAKLRRLPGLVENHSEYFVLVEVPDHPHDHPYLIVSKDVECTSPCVDNYCPVHGIEATKEVKS
jgi:hypothetical protein